MAAKGQSKSSDFEYWWLIIFEWCHKTESPFSMHVLDPTFNGIVPMEWIYGKLLPNHRLEKMKIDSLRKSINYSIFAKVEKGIENLNIFLLL